MKLFWIIPFFLLQDTETFLMKNAKAKLCLQASPTDGNLLLAGCDPSSDFQDWSWQGDSLVNLGTLACLSVGEDSGVRTSACDSAGRTRWDCSSWLLSPLGSSQGYLAATRRGVSLAAARGPKAQWQGAAERSVCAEKAEHSRYLPAALASTRTYGPTALGLAPAQLEELLWFFRREDPSAWNYALLALSLVVLLLGLFLLAVNIARNRKRKMHAEAVPAVEQAELEATQALMPAQEYGHADPQKQELLPKEERLGEVLVQWRDGTITTLYTEPPEEAV
ncbi:OSTB protein, partial [Dromaius novaehollandiae]|nr:OSTB protein [Dromaius novaehollandiae]